MSDSVRSHRRQPTRLCRLWDSPGKNSGVGCHFLLQKSCTEVDDNLGFTRKGEPLKWDRKQTKIVTVEEGWCYRIKDLRGLKTTRGFQDSSSDTLPANSEDMRRGFDPRVGKVPWRREWQSTTVIAWRIPCTEESGGLQSVGLQRVRHDWSDLT